MKWKTKTKTKTTKIMADKTMPPNDPMPTPDAGMGASSAEMAPEAGAPAGEGSVMVAMPKDAFDAIHQLIVQLAQGVDSLAQGVNQQASGAGEAPAAPVAAEEPAVMDEEFLKGIAEAGSQR
jgi:hypothetical protein